MYSRCGDIVNKFYKSQGRGKTPDNYQKVDRIPRGKQNPTPIGQFTETGEKPTLIGTITVGDTTNCATKPETTKNCKNIKPKRLFKNKPPNGTDIHKDSSKESRNKTPGRSIKTDRLPRIEVNPTPNGPVTVAGVKPTLIGSHKG